MTDQPLTPLGDALAGALGACFANVATYPLDVSKTRIQAGKLQREITVRGPDGKTKKIKVNHGLFSGVSSIALKDGLKSLYAGLGASTTSTFSMQLSFFYALSLVRSSYLERQAKKSGGKAPALSTGMELVLGAVAGALAQVFTIPVSVIATRQQLASRHSPTGGASSDGPPRGAATISGKPASKEDSTTGTLKAASEVAVSKLTEENSFLGVARDILREDGITGLWRGLRPSLVLTVNPAITYGMFERVKTLVLASTSDGKMTPMRSFLIGILSKSLATVVTFPYILAKVRVQSSHEKLKALPFLIKVLQEQGLSGWYQGMQAQIVKAVLTQALLFYFRDHFSNIVKVLMNRQSARKVVG